MQPLWNAQESASVAGAGFAGADPHQWTLGLNRPALDCSRPAWALARGRAGSLDTIVSVVANYRMADPITAFAHYRVKEGRVDDFLALVAKHGPILRRLGLVTDQPARVYVGFEKRVEGPLVIEIFEWVDPDASGRAHTHPEVSGVWEAMGPLCEERDGRPPFEFPNLREVSLP